MLTLKELNEQRIKCQQYAQTLGAMNAYGLTSEEQLAQSARYQLASDAWMRAETDYQKALANTSTAELIALTTLGETK